jgi:hypothetical protein
LKILCHDFKIYTELQKKMKKSEKRIDYTSLSVGSGLSYTNFQTPCPFIKPKPPGEGNRLGLSLSYDIMQTDTAVK